MQTLTARVRHVLRCTTGAALGAALILGSTVATAGDMRLKVAGVAPVDHYANEMLEQIKADIEAADVGLKVKVFPAAQLGSGEELLEDTIRGNVDTRLRKAAGDECDGTVIAVAGLDRMGMSEVITEYLSPEEFVPPPGQGAMAVEIRADDERIAEVVASADHAPTKAAVTAERSFLEALGGGCQVPVGAYAEFDSSDSLRLTVFMAAPDGSTTYRVTVTGAPSDPVGLAAAGWEVMREQGAAELLA